MASKLLRDQEVPISEVCGAVGVSRSTLYRYLTPNGVLRRQGNNGDGVGPSRFTRSEGGS